MTNDQSARAGRELMPEVRLFLGLIAPRVETAVSRYAEDVRARQERNRAALVETTLEQVGDAERLFEEVNRDSRLQWLLGAAVDAATRASSEDKARALGRVLASGALAADDAQVDEAMQRFRIVADLEPVDVKVLDLLAGITFHLTIAVDGPRDRSEPLDGAAPRYILLSELYRFTDLTPIAVEAAVGVLQRHGLVGYQVVLGSASAWYASDLGVAMLEYLVDMAGTVPDAQPPPDR